MKSLLTTLLFSCLFTQVISQNGVIKGTLTDATNNETIPFANIYIEQTQSGVASDLDGNYIISNLKPGIYNIIYSFVGYQSKSIAEVIVNPNKPTVLDVQLLSSSTSLEEVEIKASPFEKSFQSPEKD